MKESHTKLVAYEDLIENKEYQFQTFVKIFKVLTREITQLLQACLDMQDDMNILCEQIKEQNEQIDTLKEALKTHGEIASEELNGH